MPDNSAQIAALQAILNAGVRQGAVDGQQATFDPDSIRRRIAELQREDTTDHTKRPRISTIDMRVAF